MRLLFSILLLLTLFVALGCSDSDDDSAAFRPQYWRKVQIVLESRPQLLRLGMNELLVLATGPRGLPVSDMVISMRMSDQDIWRQAIQDGGSGVYRRALLMRPGDHRVALRLRQGRDQVTLFFPLKKQLE